MRDRYNLGVEGFLGLLAFIAVFLIYLAPLPGMLAKGLALFVIAYGAVVGFLNICCIGIGRSGLGSLLPFGLAIAGVIFFIK